MYSFMLSEKDLCEDGAQNCPLKIYFYTYLCVHESAFMCVCMSVYIYVCVCVHKAFI